MRIFRWKKYSLFWTKDKNKILDKFIDTGPTLEAYDQKFVYYTETAAELDKIKDFYDIGPIRVNKRPLLNQVIDRSHLKMEICTGTENDSQRTAEDE